MSSLLTALSLIFPLIISGTLHMFAVKKDFLKQIKVPISKQYFGENKTYRGFLLVPLFTIIGVFASLWTPFYVEKNLHFIEIIILGAGLGFFYTLFELPNSFIKRKLRILPGKTAERNKLFFIFFDQADSVFGCLVFYHLFFSDLDIIVSALVLILGPAIHLFINFLLYLLKLRSEAM